MKSDPAHLLSISHATMGFSKGPTPDVWIECEYAVIPPLMMADDDVPPEVDEVPQGVFVWT